MPTKLGKGGTAYNRNWSFSGFNIPNNTMFNYHGKPKQWASTQYKEIKKLVSESDDGAIFFCTVNWRGYNSGHVFIVHNDNGVARFFDPQTNEKADDYFNIKAGYNLITEDTSLMRVDNLSLNGEILKEIVRKKGEGKRLYDEEHLNEISI